MSRTILSASLLLILLLALSQQDATAADLVGVADITPVPAERFEVAPAYSGSFSAYGWLPFMKGETGVNGLGPVDVDLSPKDILEILDFTFMGTGDLHWGKYGMFADLIYLKVSDGAATPGPLFGSANIGVEVTIATLAGTYEIFRSGEDRLEVMAGARLWSIEADLDLSAGILPAASAGDTIHWWDPLVGVRGHKALSDKWFVSGTAAIGGFGVGSDLMWDAFAGLGYKFTDSISMSAGYRAFSVDYSDSGDVVDLVSHGPLVGLTFRF
jgi:hypothetical protein